MEKVEKSRPGLYLSGSMEYSSDSCTWRKKIYKALHSYYKVIIPNKVDLPFDKDDPEFKVWMREKFVIPDMINVSTSKFFLVKLDKEVFQGAGTISEITTACWLGKDIVAFLDGITEKEIPAWTLGCLEGALFVKDVDAAIDLYKKRAKRLEIFRKNR